MNKSDSIGTPVYVVKTPRGAALYKRIERIYEERMKRREAREKIHLKRYSTDPEYKRIIDNIHEKFDINNQPKNKLAWLESIIIFSIVLSIPIAITACAYFLVDFLLNH